VNRDATDSAFYQLNLARVHADADVEPEPRHLAHDGKAAADGTGRPFEGHEEAVSGAIDLTSTKTLELTAHDHVVRFEQVTPCPVAQLRSAIGRPDDVGEEHCDQHAIDLYAGPGAGHEGRDLRHERTLVPHPRQVVATRKGHQLRPRDPRRHVFGLGADIGVDAAFWRLTAAGPGPGSARGSWTGSRGHP